jgi:putative two-component system response regulator
MNASDICPGAIATSDDPPQFDRALEGDAVLVLPNGRKRTVRVARRPLDDDLSDYAVVTLLDITELTGALARSEEQLGEISRLSDTVLAQALSLKRYSEDLEVRVRHRTEEIREANMDAIVMLAVASEAKDQDTGAHVLRLRYLAKTLAAHVDVDDDQAERIGYSAVLHDVGKMQIPDEILKKPGPLTPDERLVMQTHTLAGERILGTRSFFELARRIARSHHENWDGSGYPDGLAGANIPLAARIVRLCDVYDALTHPRVYKPAVSAEDAVRVIRRGRGKLFDPRLTDSFIALHESRTLSDDLREAAVRA